MGNDLGCLLKFVTWIPTRELSCLHGRLILFID